jgi:DNA mismatch repair protein MutS
MDNIIFLSKTIAKVDVLMTKTYMAVEYRYCKPEILLDQPKAFVDAKELRHCLIEQIQENELYVDNDIAIGNTGVNGILLYGTNSVGKTSLIRALGIAVIMAQCGMYVPSTKFQYKPYSAIFSRIVGNDNLFKGLSTFSVEMSELRTILNLSDSNSLVLGDELCSGTETESALSIFVSGLEHLDRMKSSFIFATHFHEVVSYSEIKCMQNLRLKHLEVVYDNEQDCLIYDRKLKDGSGPRIYGLEVCKSLHMNIDFINNAFKIRAKYFNSSPSFLNSNNTRYNAKKIRGVCEICKERPGSEIHHLQFQEQADEKGFIGNFHKNHKANLVSICEICHNNEHNNQKVSSVGLKKKTTKGIQLY